MNDNLYKYSVEKMKKFYIQSCQQVVLLNNQLDELRLRYQRADAAGNKPSCANLRIQLCVTEGVRDMYYEYASHSMERLNLIALHQNEL